MHFENFKKSVGIGVGTGRTGTGICRRARLLAAFGELFEEEGDDMIQRRAAARRHHRFDRSQALEEEQGRSMMGHARIFE